MTTIYGAYDKTSETYGLGWADQWDYKFNDKYGTEEDSQATASTGNNQKLAKVKAVASTGVDKTKSVVTSGAQKLKSGTSTGFKWIKEKVDRVHMELVQEFTRQVAPPLQAQLPDATRDLEHWKKLNF